ncbi:hypothetical protein JCM21900_004973 [Sporobolomyces salmonicolor]
MPYERLDEYDVDMFYVLNPSPTLFAAASPDNLPPSNALKPDLPILVFVHSGASSVACWKKQLSDPRFANNFNLFAMDYRWIAIKRPQKVISLLRASPGWLVAYPHVLAALSTLQDALFINTKGHGVDDSGSFPAEALTDAPSRLRFNPLLKSLEIDYRFLPELSTKVEGGAAVHAIASAPSLIPRSDPGITDRIILQFFQRVMAAK